MSAAQVAILAPFAGALLATPLRHQPTRRAVRIALGLIAVALAAYALPSLDRLSACFAAGISVISFLSLLFSCSIFPKVELADARWASRPSYFLLLGAFWSSMLAVVTSGTFIGVWTGIAATTLATTFLVGFSGGKTAIEAAWKYLILCSFGIGIALLGMLLLGRAAMSAGVTPELALSWSALHGATLEPALGRAGILLMLLGFGTKAGLAPMHSWLPDAHSKAPAPISALLSGLLVSCSLYAIVRLQYAAAGDVLRSLNETMLVLGALSVCLGALLMLAQRDVKRLLSYSTVEHAGLVAIALSLGTPLGLLAALYHIANHAFSKSAAFLAVGVIHYGHGSTSIGLLHGLWNEKRGKLFLAPLVALAGLPPFGMLFSELLILIAAVAAHQWFAFGIAIVGMIVGFAALARLAIDTESGESSNGRRRVPRLAMIATGCATLAMFACALVPFTGWLR